MFVKFRARRPGPTLRCPDEPWLRSDGARGELCLVLCLYWPLHENQRLAAALDAKAQPFSVRVTAAEAGSCPKIDEATALRQPELKP